MSLNKQCSRAFNRQRDLPNIALEIFFDDTSYDSWSWAWDDDWYDYHGGNWQDDLECFRERESDEEIFKTILDTFDKEFFV